MIINDLSTELLGLVGGFYFSHIYSFDKSHRQL